MNQTWVLRTGRLIMRPVAYADLPDLIALKGDPMVYAIMLGGVRSPVECAEDLAEDISFWGAKGVGMWSVRDAATEAFLGYVGFHGRPDDRGIALRFAFVTSAQGRGYASEAASAALRFAHDHAGLPRLIAVARETNFASRQVLGSIGMHLHETYERDGYNVLVYESVRNH